MAELVNCHETSVEGHAISRVALRLQPDVSWYCRAPLPVAHEELYCTGET